MCAYLGGKQCLLGWFPILCSATVWWAVNSCIKTKLVRIQVPPGQYVIEAGL
jgi:hypothetical protein